MRIFLGDNVGGWRLYGVWIRHWVFVGLSIVEGK